MPTALIPSLITSLDVLLTRFSTALVGIVGGISEDVSSRGGDGGNEGGALVGGTHVVKLVMLCAVPILE